MQAERSTTAASCADFRLNQWLVEPALGRLSAGGETHRVRPLLMELLVVLVRNQGRVVSQDEIRRTIWGKQFLAESALTRLVAELRQALGDDTHSPRFVETVSKRGYRLVAPVGWAGPAGKPVPARLSLVVLPFADMAEKRDQEYFCDGMAEELTNALTRLGRLRVIARTSAFAFKGRGVDVREIGRQLGVDVIVEGSVQKSAGRLRITVQLVGASDGSHLWSERFDRPEGDIFAIEDDIARAVVKTLQARLQGDEGPRSPRQHSRNPEAHDIYLRGRHLWGKRAPDAVERAIRCFEEVIGSDPGHARAHAALGECYGTSAFLGYLAPGVAFPRAKQAAAAAIRLDPESPEGYGVLGLVSAFYEWEWAEAEGWFVRAREAGPSYAQTRLWHALALSAAGRLEEARAKMEEAFDLDPLSPVVQATLGSTLLEARDFSGAVDRCRKALELDPDHMLANFHLGRSYFLMGRDGDALEPLQKAARGYPVAMGLLGAAWHGAGRPDKAEEILAELHRMSKERYVGAVAFISLSGRLQGPGAAIEWLAKALDEHEGLAPLLNVDPSMDEFRGDPRVEALFARLRMPVQGRAEI